MKSKIQNNGFTIIETLIVLAITAILFVVLLSSITNTQSNVTFKTAVLDLQEYLQKTIDAAADGNFQGGGISCASTSSTPSYTPALSNRPGPGFGGQGTNQQCQFIGLGIDFRRPWVSTVPLAIGIPSTGVEPVQNIQNYPVAALAPTNPGGCELDYTGGPNAGNPYEPCTTYYPSYTYSNNQNMNDDSYTYGAEGTLNYAYSETNPPASGPTGVCNMLIYIVAVGFSGSYLSSSSGAVSMSPYIVESPTDVCVSNTLTYILSEAGWGYLANYFYGATLHPATYVAACYNSGTTNESAFITINSGGSSTSASGLTVGTTYYTGLGCP